MEQRLVDLDARLKKNIDISGPNLDKCVLALEELESLPIAKLMLKKQPDIVCTVEKLRKYVGPPGCGEDQKALTRTIRVKADKFSRKVKTAFGIPMESGLWSEFEPLAIEFRNAVSGMDKTQVLAMVSDPVTTVS